MGDIIVVGVIVFIVLLRGVAPVVMMSGLSAAAGGANPPAPSAPWCENTGCESLVGVMASAGSLLVSSSSSSGIGMLSPCRESGKVEECPGCGGGAVVSPRGPRNIDRLNFSTLRAWSGSPPPRAWAVEYGMSKNMRRERAGHPWLPMLRLRRIRPSVSVQSTTMLPDSCKACALLTRSMAGCSDGLCSHAARSIPAERLIKYYGRASTTWNRGRWVGKNGRRGGSGRPRTMRSAQGRRYQAMERRRPLYPHEIQGNAVQMEGNGGPLVQEGGS